MKTIKLNEADYISVVSNPLDAVYQEMVESIGKSSSHLKLEMLAEVLKNNEVVKKYVTAPVQKKIDSITSSSPNLVANVPSIISGLLQSIAPYAQTDIPSFYESEHDAKTKVDIKAGVTGYDITVPVMFVNDRVKILKWMYKYYYKIATYMITNQIPYCLDMAASVVRNTSSKSDKYSELKLKVQFLTYANYIPDKHVPVVLEAFRKSHAGEYDRKLKEARLSPAKYSHVDETYRCQTFYSVHNAKFVDFVYKSKLPTNEINQILEDLHRCAAINARNLASSHVSSGSFSTIFSLDTDLSRWELERKSIRATPLLVLENIKVNEWAEKQTNPWTSYIYFEEPLTVATTLSRRSAFVTTPAIEFTRENSVDSSDEDPAD